MRNLETGDPGDKGTLSYLYKSCKQEALSPILRISVLTYTLQTLSTAFTKLHFQK